MTAIEGPGSTGRRAFLIVGAAAGLGLAGCSAADLPAPRTHRTTPAPAPQPTPLPGTIAAAARENDLAGFAAAALDRFGTQLTSADHNLLSRLRDAHRAHAAVLEQQDPTDERTTASPSPTAASAGTPAAAHRALGHSVKAARVRLRRLESRASSAYAALATAPAGPADQLGRLALLWGSLATASAGYARVCASGADPGPAMIGDHRADVALPDPATVIRNLLGQCYAMIFGYQTAIAALSGAQADQARSGLSRYRALGDQLADRLSRRQLPVPAPQAAYRLPIQPTTAASAARLLDRMETRMLPYLGQWLATTTSGDRHTALQAMITTGTDRTAWSPKIIVWPGYPLS